MASSWYGIVHHLSGPMDLASTQNPVHWTLGPVSHAEPAALRMLHSATHGGSGSPTPFGNALRSRSGPRYKARVRTPSVAWEGLPTSRPVWEERCFHRALRFRQDSHQRTCKLHRLLGPCFKTGREWPCWGPSSLAAKPLNIAPSGRPARPPQEPPAGRCSHRGATGLGLDSNTGQR